MIAVNPISLYTLLALSTSILANGIPVVVSPNLNISTNPNTTAHLPSCTNLTSNATTPSPYCYTKLQETAYLTNWNLTSPELCAPTELWSTCFLRSVYGKPGPNCTSLTNYTSACQQYNCTSLSLTDPLCPPPTPASINTTTTTTGASTTTTTTAAAVQTAEEYYAAFNIYALQSHISTWSAALSSPSSRQTILNALNPRLPNTASSLLTTLISTYGLNTSVNADAQLIKLVAVRTGPPEPAVGNGRVRGERSSVSAEVWQGLLRERLGDVLGLAMARFELFLGAVQGGAYSARGLAGVGELRRALEG
ncbi:hypothetical protein BDR22DRAFT_893040 [Usnea florida]